MAKRRKIVVRSQADGLRALRHPAVKKQHVKALKWRPKHKRAVLIPCSQIKPYFESASHKHGYLPALEGKDVDVFVVSEPMGVIPYAWADQYPNESYEFAPKHVRGKTRELLVDRLREWMEKVGYKYDKIYLALPLHHMALIQDAHKAVIDGVWRWYPPEDSRRRPVPLPFVDLSISACRAEPSCPNTAFRATSKAYRKYLSDRVKNPGELKRRLT